MLIRMLITFLAILASVGVLAQKAADETPTEFYHRFDAAVAAASKLEEILPLLASERRAQFAETPAEDRQMIFGMLKQLRFKEVKIVSETKDGDKAELTATGVGPDGSKVDGAISLLVEEDEWRMDIEQWRVGS